MTPATGSSSSDGNSTLTSSQSEYSKPRWSRAAVGSGIRAGRGGGTPAPSQPELPPSTDGSPPVAVACCFAVPAAAVDDELTGSGYGERRTRLDFDDRDFPPPAADTGCLDADDALSNALELNADRSSRSPVCSTSSCSSFASTCLQTVHERQYNYCAVAETSPHIFNNQSRRRTTRTNSVREACIFCLRS